MTTTHIVALLAVLISAVVSLVIAHLHRKQMRQVELFKQNPENGLVPPPGPLTRFVTSKWDLILGVGFPLASLIHEMAKDAPVTRGTVLVVSLLITVIIVHIVARVQFYVLMRIIGVLEKFAEAMAKQVRIQERTVQLVDSLASETSQNRADS